VINWKIKAGIDLIAVVDVIKKNSTSVLPPAINHQP
jgi:hypothetical protein